MSRYAVIIYALFVGWTIGESERGDVGETRAIQVEGAVFEGEQDTSTNLHSAKSLCEKCFWPIRGRDVSRHNYAANIVGPEDLSLGPVWSFKTNNRVGSQLVVDEQGDMYFGSADKGFYSIHSNGTLKWKFWTKRASVGSGALTNDGTLYIGNWDSEMYAIDSANGKLKWKINLPKYISSSPIVGKDGTLYFGCGDGSMYAFSPEGVFLWKVDTQESIIGSPAMSEDGNTLYIGSVDSTMIALDTYYGTLLWNTTTSGSLISSPVLSSDELIVYVCSTEGELHAISTRSGDILWNATAGHQIIGSPSIDAEGHIIVGSHDGYVYSFRPDGSQSWRTSLNGNAIESTPLVDQGGHIYVGSWGGAMFVLRSCDGAVLSEYRQTEGVSTSAILHERTGYLIYGGGDGIIRAFAPKCHERRWSVGNSSNETMSFRWPTTTLSCSSDFKFQLKRTFSSRFYRPFCPVTTKATTCRNRTAVDFYTGNFRASAIAQHLTSLSIPNFRRIGVIPLGLPRVATGTWISNFSSANDRLSQSSIRKYRAKVEEREHEERIRRTEAMDRWGEMNHKLYWAKMRVRKYKRYSEQWADVANVARSALASVAAKHSSVKSLSVQQLQALYKILTASLECDESCRRGNRPWREATVELIEDAIRAERERQLREAEKHEIETRTRLKEEGRRTIAERMASSEKIHPPQHIATESSSTEAPPLSRVVVDAAKEEINPADRHVLDNESDVVVPKLTFESGCTDSRACNYDAKAVFDDASCVYPPAYRNCEGVCIAGDLDEDGVCDDEKDEIDWKKDGNVMPAGLTAIAALATEMEKNAAANATRMEVAGKRTRESRDQFATNNNLTASGTYDVSRSRRVFNALDVVRWHYRAESPIVGGIAMSPDGSALFAGTTTGEMLALGMRTGKLLWKYRVEGADGTIVSTPLVWIRGDGASFLYFGSWNGRLYSLSASTGELAWFFEAEGAISSSPLLLPRASAQGTDLIFFGSGDGYVYALNAVNGNIVWKLRCDGPVYASPTLSPNQSVMYIGSHDSFLYAIDVFSGEKLWASSLGAPIESSSCVGADGHIFTGAKNGNMTAIDPEGRKVWSFSTGRHAIVANPALSESKGLLYVASKNMLVHALNASSGALRWLAKVGQITDASLRIDRGGYVVSAGSQGNIYALNGATGALHFAVNTANGGRIYSNPLIPGDGQLAFAQDNGDIFLLEKIF